MRCLHLPLATTCPSRARRKLESYAMAIPNPIVGAYSRTDASQGTGLSQKMADLVSGIAYGRDSISMLDQGVRDWRASGGDQIRAEYEAALQAGLRPGGQRTKERTH